MCAAWRSRTTTDAKSMCPMAQRLARIAARLFATRGYDATSVREIVEEAGVAKPTLYHYFGNKEGVAKALLTEPMTEFIRSCETLFGLESRNVSAADETAEASGAAENGETAARDRTRTDEGGSVTAEADGALDPVEALARFLELNYEFCLEDPDRGRFLYALMFGPSGAHLSQELIQYSQKLFALIMTGASRVAQARGMSPASAAEFARAVRGMIVVTTMDCLYPNQDRNSAPNPCRNGQNADRAILEEGLARRQIHGLLDGFAAPLSRCAAAN